MKVTALYAAVVEWATSAGAKDIGNLPGVWHGRTRKIERMGPIDVRINGHLEEIDGIPPGTIKLGMDDYFPGIIGLVWSDGGTLISSPVEGENEEGLIAHFKAQATPTE